ncbi:MAG: TIGR01620 family protein [Gammaproteobacteria bacterium]|nr:TIGR01620 family protein [Gammaproteobacteria bacterium]MBK8307103.1 TIGR01620 family protein [Gammaproteobacteria bacterium]
MEIKTRIELEEVATVRAPPAAGALARRVLEPAAEDILPPPATTGTQRPARRHRVLFAGLLALGAVALAQFGVHLWEMASESPVLGGAWFLAWSLVLAGSAGAATREWQRLRRMRNRQDARSRADEMLARQGIGQARGFCEELALAGGQLESAGYRSWAGQVELTHNNREVLELYSRLVLAEPDRRALRGIVKQAGDTAVMIAFSQFAAIDMLLIFWRNLRVIEDVTAAYGIELGYWGRIGLLRQVLRNMAYAGAAEVAAEVGMEMMGASITGKISTSVAQGIGAGLLTARLGLRTMDACRPIPWGSDERPKLDAVRRELRGVFAEYLGKL